jgi:hypothetical protein
MFSPKMKRLSWLLGQSVATNSYGVVNLEAHYAHHQSDGALGEQDEAFYESRIWHPYYSRLNPAVVY